MKNAKIKGASIIS